MNISNKFPIMVFVNEYEGKKSYKLGLADKKQDGSYEYGSINAKFRVQPNIENRGKININSAWLCFYKFDNKCIPYVFINEYEVVSGLKTSASEIFDGKIVINDDDLPF